MLYQKILNGLGKIKINVRPEESGMLIPGDWTDGVNGCGSHRCDSRLRCPVGPHIRHTITWGPLSTPAPRSEAAPSLGRGEHSFHDDRKRQSCLLVLFFPMDMGAPLSKETPGVNPQLLTGVIHK